MGGGKEEATLFFFFCPTNKMPLTKRGAQQRIRGSQLSVYELVSLCVCEREVLRRLRKQTHTHSQRKSGDKEECRSSGLIITYFTDDG